ncbi:unnamed protein product [Trichogramma brassicae]|uniref:Uncharacterized bromodomain-containing protein 10 helical domain-containing protein n=1 Tax=Trichogramma brassicae TaxID=86971 RepID=A0A6H5IPX1_9HYME|nr:unnamed protein product [Trichogramma brassicae]
MPKKGRKRKISAEGRDYDEWEKTKILPDSLRDEMESMWELPQIYHFLQLTKDVLHISHLSMFEVERMLLMPKASQQLANIMTCLLSSPSTKSKQQEVPPMPYKFWTNILMQKLKGWFKIYEAKQREPVKVFDALGIESEFWSVFPEALELEGRDFESFNFRQRVWLLKALCDTAQHSRKLIQEEIAKQPTESQFETVLGVDRTPDEQSSENWSGSQGWCLISPERPSQSQTTVQTMKEVKSLDATLDDSKVDDNKKENENNQQVEETGEKSTNEVDIKQEDGEEPSSKKSKTSEEQEDKAETKRPVRSLRARGVSSYIEHLFDEDSSDEEYRSKLSEANPIADVRVAYIPSTSAATSESSKKSPTSDFEEEEQSEDSDQDWCLPGTRKKKRKRMSFGRRFKTMQAIRTESEQIRRNDQMVEAAGAQNLRIEKVHTLGPDGKVYELSVEDVVAPSTPTVNNTSPNQTIYVNPPVGSVVAKQTVAAYPQQQQTRNLQQQQQWPRKVMGRYPHTTMQQVQPPPMPRMIRMVPPQPGNVMGPRGPNNAAQRPTMGPRGPGGVTQRPRMSAQPRIISSTTLSPNRPLPNQQNVTQQLNSRQKQSYLHEAASKRMPNNALRPGQRMVPSQTKAGPANQVPRRTPTKAGPAGRGAARVATNNSATTLIVLSDSDEEIQVVKTPSNNTQTPKAKTSSSVKKSFVDDTPVSVKKVLPPELLQRMEDGGISIVPIKPAPKPANPSSTQIVVVVNETGSHYALVLPNGSKLILTPEQVAQIRESNGGKLVV